MTDGSTAAVVLGHLADPARRRVIAAVILRAATREEIEAATGLTARAVVTALGRLEAGGLLGVDEQGHLALAEDTLRQAATEVRSYRPDAPAPDDDETKVLRSFVREGRLRSIPVQRAKRLVVLDRLAQDFEPGHRYPERDVNAVLKRWHADTAALRRYLVDEGFLTREAGWYWRTGGTVIA
jgi:hypothetical protein